MPAESQYAALSASQTNDSNMLAELASGVFRAVLYTADQTTGGVSGGNVDPFTGRDDSAAGTNPYLADASNTVTAPPVNGASSVNPFTGDERIDAFIAFGGADESPTAQTPPPSAADSTNPSTPASIEVPPGQRDTLDDDEAAQNAAMVARFKAADAALAAANAPAADAAAAPPATSVTGDAPPQSSATGQSAPAASPFDNLGALLQTVGGVLYSSTTGAPFAAISNWGPHNMFTPLTGFDTGSALLNAPVNAIAGIANLSQIPFNLLSNVTGALKDFALAHGASQDNIDAFNVFFLAEGAVAVELAEASIGYLGGVLGRLSTETPELGGGLDSISQPLSAAGSELDTTSAAGNFQHVIRGGDGERGIGVLHIDAAGMSDAQVEQAIAKVRDMDLQAGIAGGTVRTPVPDSIRAAAKGWQQFAHNVGVAGPLEHADHLLDMAAGGSPLGPFSGLSPAVNSAIGGQWGRYGQGFIFDGISLVDRVTGEFLYESLGLEREPAPIFDFSH